MGQTDIETMKARARGVLEAEFRGSNREMLAATLFELAQELKRESNVRKQRVGPDSDEIPSADSSPSWSARAPVSAKLTPRDAKNALLDVLAEDEVRVASLLHQVVEVGALLISIDGQTTLNQILDVKIGYLPLGFSIELTGRVVNTSMRGTALEIIQLGREDRAGLEKMFEDYRDLVPQDEAISTVSTTKPASTKRKVKRESMTSPSTRLGRPANYGRLGTTLNEPRIQMRRQVKLVDPDDVMLDTTERSETSNANDDLYGPTMSWVEPTGDPERVESLANDRVLDIFMQLSEHGFTGIAQIEESDEDKSVSMQLFFDSGFLVDILQRPRSARRELASMLLAAKRVDEEQIAIAAAHADEQRITMSRSLLDLNLLAPEQIRHAIAGRLTYLLRELCTMKSGRVRIFEESSLSAGFLPAPPLRVHVAVERTIFKILFDKLRQLNQRERELAGRGELDAYPEALSTERERLERTLSNEDHVKLFGRVINGRRRLREVFTESPLANAETFGLIFALHRMGLLQFDRSLHHTVVRERFRENVTVKYLSVHKASYFEVLNVHWSSHDTAIEKAYQDLIIQFDPERVPEGMEPEVHQRVVEIRDRVESAYQVLVGREHRHAYRMRIMPEYKLAHAIPLFLKQSELAEKREQWDDAADSLRRVLEIDPLHRDAKRRLEMVLKRAIPGLGEESSSAPL